MTAARQSPGVDPDCVKLARKFLLDDPRYATHREAAFVDDVRNLSQDIQAAIEDWFFANPPLPPGAP